MSEQKQSGEERLRELRRIVGLFRAPNLLELGASVLRPCADDIEWAANEIARLRQQLEESQQQGERRVAILGATLERVGVGGVICRTHHKAVLVCHVHDGNPCDDYTLAESARTLSLDSSVSSHNSVASEDLVK